MSAVNVPLLRKAVEWAEVEAQKPFAISEWYQGHYVLEAGQGAATIDMSIRARLGKAPECGTCFCIAGKVVFDATGEQLHPEVADVARLELGLTHDEADWLFHASNSIEDVRRIAESIAGERL